MRNETTTKNDYKNFNNYNDYLVPELFPLQQGQEWNGRHDDSRKSGKLRRHPGSNSGYRSVHEFQKSPNFQITPKFDMSRYAASLDEKTRTLIQEGLIVPKWNLEEFSEMPQFVGAPGTNFSID
ncbi:hypothetical protein HELRODRAFT_161624 [Helobdella robusta]|uniref:Uncharacterized protein n=1 Tax=Helobdella robusta TaxID=6412 RepID=T1ERQ1_HELRO|nr:hypothetical protein HELRODRAFT_161624 [Helobdella robusta]ESO02364.1 hypothetical protein HELRODRAFT_161624 [Helobdella robusta]